MSLLNEALRKNRSEKMQKVIFSTPSKSTGISKNALILIFIFAAVAAGFTYMWTMDRGNNLTPSVISAKTEIMNNVPTNPIPGPASTPLAKGNVVEQPAVETSAIKDETSDTPVQITPDNVEIREEQKKEIAKQQIAKEDDVHEVIIPDPEKDADALLKNAIQLHQQERYDMALMMYKKVLNLNPANSEALFNMASIYITMNRYQDAYDILSGLAATYKRDSKTILNLAVSEIGLMKYADAISHLETMDGDDPELLFEISFHRGVALSRIGKPDEAIKNYIAAEKINNNRPVLLLNMAVLYDRYGKYKEAIDYYTKFINSGSSGKKEMDTYKNRVEVLSAHLPVSDENGLSKN